MCYVQLKKHRFSILAFLQRFFNNSFFPRVKKIIVLSCLKKCLVFTIDFSLVMLDEKKNR